LDNHSYKLISVFIVGFQITAGLEIFRRIKGR